ncbi:hypothetical protein [Mucilaginibacter sp.]
MRETLKKISRQYDTPERLRKSCEKEYGLSYEEALEMAYENIQLDAALASKGVQRIN